MLSVIDSLVLTLTTRILMCRTSLWIWLDGNRRPSVNELTSRIAQVDRFASKPGFANHAHQSAPGIGRDWIAVVETVGVDDEPFIGRKDAEVGIESRRDLPLLTKPGQPRRPFRHPPRNLRERVLSLAGLGPHDGEAELERCNTAPRGAEISAGQFLHRDGAGRVVGDNGVDDALLETAPER